MIYDCFIFFNELELLELRLFELKDVVDKFVLVESTKTFTGESKNLFYLDNKDLYNDFNQKIIHVIVKDMPDLVRSVKDREIFLRNSVTRGLKDCQDDDIIMLSDVDEIPNKHIIRDIRSTERPIDIPTCLSMRLFNYYINCLVLDIWPGTVITKCREFKTKDPQWFRDNRGAFNMIYSAGWHFSYLYGVDRIIKKLQNIGDPISAIKWKDPEYVKKCIEECTDIFEDRQLKFKVVPLDSNFPETIRNNPSKYPIKV